VIIEGIKIPTPRMAKSGQKGYFMFHYVIFTKIRQGLDDYLAFRLDRISSGKSYQLHAILEIIIYANHQGNESLELR
jgi:hypothetical protein